MTVCRLAGLGTASTVVGDAPRMGSPRVFSDRKVSDEG